MGAHGEKLKIQIMRIDGESDSEFQERLVYSNS
jgi:hypothetical protein